MCVRAFHVFHWQCESVANSLRLGSLTPSIFCRRSRKSAALRPPQNCIATLGAAWCSVVILVVRLLRQPTIEVKMWPMPLASDFDAVLFKCFVAEYSTSKIMNQERAREKSKHF